MDENIKIELKFFFLSLAHWNRSSYIPQLTPSACALSGDAPRVIDHIDRKLLGQNHGRKSGKEHPKFFLNSFLYLFILYYHFFVL